MKAFVLFFLCFLVEGTVIQANPIDNALTIEITKEGFSALAKEISLQIGKEKILQPVPNQRWGVAYLADVEAEGISATLAVGKIEISPRAGGLRVGLRIDHGILNLNTIRMKLPMVPFVKTTCSNSRINFVSSHPLQIDTQMGLSLTADGRVAITDPQVAFSLEESNYRVEGPDSCSGSFSVTDYVSKYVLNRLFNNARGVIQDALKDEITKILPRIAGLINQQLASTYPLQLPHMVLLPRLDSGLKLSPTELSISAEHLVARAGVRVVPSPQAKSLVRSPILEQAPRVMARFGVNLELVNHLLQQVVAQKKTELHLSPHLHEVFSSLLKVEELKTIWPELVTKPREHELMQLFVSLAEAPRVSFKKDADMDLLHVELPDLLLRWQTRSKGAWQNFFFVHTHLSGDLSVRVVEGNLALDFKNFHSELRGSWAEGYQPRQEFFDAELFKEVLEIILHTARSSLGKTVFPLPAVVFAGEKMALDSVMLAAPFAHFSVLGNN